MAKTGHPNFDYTCQGSWRGATHNFSIVGNHSGTSFGAADAQTFMEGDQSPYCLSFAPFQATGITVVQSRYYDGQNSAPVFEATYDVENPAPDPLTATATGYDGTGEGTGAYFPLEVCCMLEALVGTSKNNKPVYCRKYIRGVPLIAYTDSGDSQLTWAISAAGNTAAKAMGDGSWYGNRIYISPNARSALTTWQALTEPGNHQIPRGRKKTTSSSQSSTIALLEKALGLTTAIPID
jgi:hypothetical protein